MNKQENKFNVIKKVVVAGGGTAGWMAAAAISKLIGEHLQTPVTLIESDQIGTIGVGEATIPTLQEFHQLLGINEHNFLNYTGGTFKLGINFENWHDLGKDYFHAFGVTGRNSWACGFQHFWLRAKQLGYENEYGEYNLEWQAAMQNKFSRLPNDGLKHAFHIDASQYAKFLRRYCSQFNLERKEGIIKDVNVNQLTGDIISLKLQSGELVEGDLFIDCTGQRGLLIGEALGVGFEDWSHWLPCDSAIAVQTESVHPPLPYTRSIAHESGWQWQIPLQDRVGNGLVYSSRFMDDESARKLLVDNIEGAMLNEPRPIKFRTGRRHQQWHKNCVSLGLASGFLEPLESTSIHLIQSGILRLLRQFPFNGISDVDVLNYNKETVFEIERIRDFIILHYHVTDRRDTEFWRHCTSMQVPELLQNKIDSFGESGRVNVDSGEMFGDSWAQVMLGQGLMPEHHHPIINTLSDKEVCDFIDSIYNDIQQSLTKLGSHQPYVEQFCASAPDRIKSMSN